MTITDFVMFPDLAQTGSTFKLQAEGTDGSVVEGVLALQARDGATEPAQLTLECEVVGAVVADLVGRGGVGCLAGPQGVGGGGKRHLWQRT